MEKAYLITKKHFEIEEVNFTKLRTETNNIILEYVYEDNKYFKRSLFELHRLEFNIGILIPVIDYSDKSIIIDLLNNIRGFEINLGVWLECRDNLSTYNIFKILNENFSNNFIIGYKNGFMNCPLSEYKNTLLYELSEYPFWNNNGDIEDDEEITFDFLHTPIKSLKLNTNYKKIYDENNLEPIVSDLNISNIIK